MRSSYEVQKKNNLFSIIMTSLIVIWLSSPYLFRNVPNTVVVIIFGAWLVSNIQYLKRRVNISPYFEVIAWMSFIVFYRVIGYSTSSWGNYYSQFFFWLFVFIFPIYSNEYSAKEQKFVLFVVWISAIINTISNIVLLHIYPTAATDIYREYGAMFLKMNIGGTSYSIFVLLFCFANIYIFLNTKNVRLKVIATIVVVISLIYFFTIQKATTFLILLIVLGLWAFRRITHNMNRQSKALFIVIMPLVILLFIFVGIPIIIDMLSNSGKYSELVGRLEEISNILFGSNYANASISGSSRLRLMIQSLNVWLTNIKTFIFGIGDATREARDISIVGAGMHSESLDCLVRYGIIGAILYFTALLKTFFSYSRKAGNKYLDYIYLGMFIYSFFNPLTSNANLGIFLFFVLPAIMAKDCNSGESNEKICNFG